MRFLSALACSVRGYFYFSVSDNCVRKNPSYLDNNANYTARKIPNFRTSVSTGPAGRTFETRFECNVSLSNILVHAGNVGCIEPAEGDMGRFENECPRFHEIVASAISLNELP